MGFQGPPALGGSSAARLRVATAKPWPFLSSWVSHLVGWYHHCSEHVREFLPCPSALNMQIFPVMPHQPAAPVEADALRHLAQATTHARIPAALKLLLLALLAAFSLADRAGRTLRRPRKDWYPSPAFEADENSQSVWDARALRQIRRIRAWIGWILRCDRAEGMALSGQRALAPCPTRAARAPPWPARAHNHPKSVAKTPHQAAKTHAQSPSPWLARIAGWIMRGSPGVSRRSLCPLRRGASEPCRHRSPPPARAGPARR